MKTLNIALAKGRLAQQSMELFESCGLDLSCVDTESRKLIFTDKEKTVSVILVKPSDVPTYVERGVADIGVVGKDTLIESNSDLYEMLDLGFAKCRLCVAAPKKQTPNPITNVNLRVATKYPSTAKAYYQTKGINIDIIKLNGSVELGPLVGLSDVIVDIVESGKTLVENGLEVTEDICDISARLVVNKVSLKTKGEIIRPLISNVRKYLNNKE
ncbi:MAG: ATP phosphoribosyltransferase [Eubacteriales bacterium]